MSIAPVGIVNAGHPRAAAAQAQELGSLIHTGDVAFCQDGAAVIDPRQAIIYGANFGRDTDTIATMAGAICGALTGVAGLPEAWVAKVQGNSFGDQAQLANKLVDVAVRKAESECTAWRILLK